MCGPLRLSKDPAPCYLRRFHFPLPCLFSPLSVFHLFCLTVVYGNCLMAILELKEKTVEIEGLEGGRERTRVSPTPVLHISELMRCAEKQNIKWGGKKQDLVRDVTVGDELVMLCLSLICWTCRVFCNSRWLKDTCGLNNPILLSHYENIYHCHAALWNPSPYSNVE